MTPCRSSGSLNISSASSIVAEALFILLEGATVASTVGVVPGAVRTAKRLAAEILADG